MYRIKTRCVFFILFGIIHAKDRKPKIYLRGEDATVHIDPLETYRKNALEITFSDYTSKQLVTNVMIYDPRNNQADTISIHPNYAGRIKGIEMNNGSLSFLLLNVNFMDSGHYIAYADSMVKGTTSILVPRHRLLGQDSEPMILNFICNITNVTSIKIEIMISKLYFFVVKYDVTRANCTDIGTMYKDRIDSCALRDRNFSFTIRTVSFLDSGIYVAWDDMDFLIDSISVEFEENNTTSILESTHRRDHSPFIPNLLSSEAENYKFEWFLVSGLVIVLVATGIVINVVGRLQKEKVSKTSTYKLTHRNGGKNTSNSSSNCVQNIEIAHTPEGTRTVLMEDKPSHDRTNFASNGNQENARRNEKHICLRGVDAAKSTVRKEPILISLCEKHQTDPTNVYDDVHQYDELEPECRFNGLYRHSKVLGTTPSENVVEQSYKYDNLVQHTYLTLRPPTTIPVVTRKTKEQVTIADSFSGDKKEETKSSRRVDPLTFNVKISKETLNDIECTGSRTGIGNRDFSNKASHPSFFELKESFSSDTIHSSNSAQSRLYQKKRNYQSFKYDTYVPRSESFEFQDVKSQVRHTP